MWIVAGNTPEPAFAGAEAAAFVQLLELADDAVLGGAGCPLQNRPEPVERQSRPIILIAAVGPKDAPIAVQVALLANGIPKRWFQMNRVDDRQVPASRPHCSCNVQFSRPVAPLAANSVALEDRPSILIDRVRHRFNSVRVAEEALRGDRPVEVAIRPFIAGRQIPLSLPRVPTDRRLEEEAIVFDQVRDPLPAGADRESDLGLVLGDHAAPSIPSRLFVDDMSLPVFNRVLEPLCFE
jgi:hypothetical protein